MISRGMYIYVMQDEFVDLKPKLSKSFLVTGVVSLSCITYRCQILGELENQAYRAK